MCSSCATVDFFMPSLRSESDRSEGLMSLAIVGSYEVMLDGMRGERPVYTKGDRQ